MGESVWYFFWCLDKTTKEVKDGDGTGNLLGAVLGAMPIRDSDVAGALGRADKTIRRWRAHLTAQGYIKTQRTPVGYRIWVKKSKKWVKGLDKNVQSDIPKMSNHSDSDRPKREIRTDISGSRLPETGNPYRQDKDSTETKQERERQTRTLSDCQNLGQRIVTLAKNVDSRASFTAKSRNGLVQAVAQTDLSDQEIESAVKEIVGGMDAFQLKNAGSNLLAELDGHVLAQREQARAAKREAQREAEILASVARQGAERDDKVAEQEDQHPIPVTQRLQA
jgi:transcriptional regulator NrdR family protein